ncbi:hypothetical protein [Romboutsia sp.]|uniref:hypothetical protein n=1 Tax=Romboutsia sp. TaxID=1965302 RepID=UPI002BEDDBBA|nr:hypothetical protein [Romboutsia sp.]HSQ89340.1 hypothetical protein [Romboutsia sp.]
MKIKLLKLIRLISGFMFCALGIVLMINANLGLCPWDILHEGISKITKNIINSHLTYIN